MKPAANHSAKPRTTAPRSKPQKTVARTAAVPESGAVAARHEPRAVAAHSKPAVADPKPTGEEKDKAAFRGYRFQRARTVGVIEVLNENSYVMAEYIQRTGSVHWQRMVLAAQREQIERWLVDHYPSR